VIHCTATTCWIYPALLIIIVEKERKKTEKAKKFAEKQAKTVNGAATPALSKNKEKKAKAESSKEEPLPEYVEETPPGEKKSKHIIEIAQLTKG